MCTEAEKKEYCISLGGKVNFAGQCHFTDALIDEDTSTKEMFDHEFLPIPRFVALLLVLPPIPTYLDLRKNF